MEQPQYPAEWTDADFEKMDWHDSTFHGIRFNNPPETGSIEDYDFDLILDLDYILERSLRDHCYDFVVAPAQLTFHRVDHLQFAVHLGHKDDMDIDTITREEITTEAREGDDYRVYRWTIELQSLSGNLSRITFESPGFTQKLTGLHVCLYEMESEAE